MTLTTLLTSISITLLPLGANVEGFKCGDIGGLYYNNKVYVCEIDSNTEFYRFMYKLEQK